MEVTTCHISEQSAITAIKWCMNYVVRTFQYWSRNMNTTTTARLPARTHGVETFDTECTCSRLVTHSEGFVQTVPIANAWL